uniref:Ribosomal protein S4 n=1 Tax=Poteriospumella lacustris TaxID=1117027 RepID=A0A7S6PV39_9STRA|nr:ribosomal protein S4 [Poteriospumella lacustris]
MVRYLGPKLKIIRRLGILPGLTQKKSTLRKKTPGQHGKKLSLQNTRTSLSNDYNEKLLEKQKLRYHYGLTERQLLGYYQMAKKKKSATGSLLLSFLESRLDCILFRLGFAPTINAARQLITHRHILVNNFLVNIPSFLCKQSDIISVKKSLRSQNIVKTFFEKKSKKRDLILKRAKQIKLQNISEKYLAKFLLPSHLKIEENPLRGHVIGSLKRKNVSVHVNELKVIEYYSR